MNELKVIVQQKVGQITWNYEELKSALAVEMEKYKNIVYDDNLITTAKSDVAFLRKLKKEVSDRRIEVKKQCLKPYELIETQAKELTALIDEPITEIDKQIKEYEEQQKSLRRQEISDFMDEVFADLPQEVITKLKNKIYDTRWENKSAKRKDWTDAIAAAHDNVTGDLQVIAGVDEEFREMAEKVYYTNLVLSESLNKVNELRRQKEMILERERQRREEDERRKAEKAAMAQARAEAEMQKVDEPVHPEKVEKQQEQSEEKPAPVVERIQSVSNQESQVNGNIYRIVINATSEQMEKIKGYINFVGAKFKEV